MSLYVETSVNLTLTRMAAGIPSGHRNLLKQSYISTPVGRAVWNATECTANNAIGDSDSISKGLVVVLPDVLKPQESQRGCGHLSCIARILLPGEI